MRLLKIMGLLAGGLVAVALIWWTLSSPQATVSPETAESETVAEETTEALISEVEAEAAAKESDESEESEDELTEEEKAEAEAEALVTAFEDLTDVWQESTKKVDLKAIAAFSDAFRKVPEDCRDECIHRALNLIPDENVMLLIGVLTDKTMPKEIVETVFNDILNRDEDVKKPILLEIYRDKEHPCWSDTAWILDVTGETPAGEASR